jgi:nitroimidazol reductase NimA-like FMN-containing flavoprotein (pyridoxamine 5'-phosphate oxidase superfamily)
MFGNLDTQEIEKLISQQVVGRIGCHADDITYIVPISYAYDGNYIYGRTYEGMKLNILRKNPKLCFQVDDLTDLANWSSVIAWGEFEELSSEKDRSEALTKLGRRVLPAVSSATMHIASMWPFSEEGEKVEGILFRIRLTEKTGRFERNSDYEIFAS